MKRRSLLALIVTMMMICSVFLGSCSIQSSGDKFTAVRFTGKTQEGRPITYEFDEECEQEFLALMDECDQLVDAGEDFQKLYDTVENVNEFKIYLEDAVEKLQLSFDMYGRTEDLEKCNRFKKLDHDYEKWHKSLIKKIADGPFRQYYFAGKSDEEIAKEVGEIYPDEYYAAQKEMDDIKSANSLLDPYDSANYADIENLYVRFVSAANAYADMKGYENYIYYVNENKYGRPYKPDDTDDFYEYVMTYVVPACINAKAEYKNAYNALNKKEKAKVDKFFDHKTADMFSDGFDHFYAYKKAVGGNFERVFDDLWREGGAFYISYENTGASAYQGEFPLTKETYLFVGKNYHDPLTVVHEFGHYFAVKSGSDTKDYDLAETQSQANEMLYMSYLKNFGRYPAQLADVMCKYHLYKTFKRIVIYTLVNEFEKMVYADDDFTIGEAQKYVEGLRKEVGDDFDDFDLDTYWYKVVIAQAGYYVSYATSLIGSYNVYRLAQDDFYGAVDTYMKLVDFASHGVAQDLESVYEYAGLKNVFYEQTFIDLFGYTSA